MNQNPPAGNVLVKDVIAVTPMTLTDILIGVQAHLNMTQKSDQFNPRLLNLLREVEFNLKQVIK